MVTDVTHLFQIPLVWPREALKVGGIEGIAVHHCATLWMRPDATVEEEINHLRAIDRYHREVRGFLGFAYHLAAFPTGRIYQVTSLKQWGAHVYQKNDRLYGVVVVGNFLATVPGEPQLNATAEGIKFLDAFLGRQVEVGPHRKWGNSTCPGNPWEQWVPGLRIKEDEMLDQADKEWIHAELQTITKHLEGRINVTTGDLASKIDAIQAKGGLTEDEAKEAAKQAAREGTG